MIMLSLRDAGRGMPNLASPVAERRYDGRRGFMKVDELSGESEADVAQEVGGTIGEAVEEGEDAGPESWEVVGEAVEVENVLLEPAPKLLDGVEPGGVGR